jgi:hypothetical protein
VPKRQKRLSDETTGNTNTVDLFGTSDNDDNYEDYCFDDAPGMPTAPEPSIEYGDTIFAGEYNPYEIYDGEHRIKYGKKKKKKVT